MKSDVADYSLIYTAETEKALGVRQTEDEEDLIWLPKSQIEFDGKEYRRGQVITVTIPDWLAEKHNLA